MQGTRVLFVDDEPSIVLTMPAILKMHGFDVIAVSTVNEALTKITSAQFDVLISDLNIGEPGDGFVVVGAMRRTQPRCVTIILTGFPGFEAAMEAIRRQVDDFLIKPAPIPTLIRLIQEKLENPRPRKQSSNERLSRILSDNKYEIALRALTEMKTDPLLGALTITDEQRTELIQQELAELATMLDSNDEEVPAKSIMQCSEERMKRYRQGYSIPLFAKYVRLLQRAIYDVVNENLMLLNLSFFMHDLKKLNDILGYQLECTLTAYLANGSASSGSSAQAFIEQ
jgi:YesN/AraC family two-component response regulator